MVLNRLACPECSAGIESSAGYTPGQLVRCPKCETEFTVEDGGSAAGPNQPAARRVGESDDFQPSTSRPVSTDRSYKNSWVRYAVLGVLLVVLGVLSFMLYQKRMNEGKDMAGGSGDDGDSARVAEPRVAGNAPRLTPMIPAGGGAGPAKSDKVEPKVKTLTADEAKTQLAGKWQSKSDNLTRSVEYRADGTFTYGREKDGKAEPPIAGKWKIVKIEPGSSTKDVTVSHLVMEWTPEGKPVINGTVILRSDATARHPHLVLDPENKEPGSTFTKVQPGGGKAPDPRVNKGTGLGVPSRGGLSREELLAKLAGMWESPNSEGALTINYASDGTYSYSVKKTGVATGTIEGRWKLERVISSMDEPFARVYQLVQEWTQEGKPATSGTILVYPDGKIEHPQLDQEFAGKHPPRAKFLKK